MQEVLRKLEKITKKKIQFLMSDHIELKRQLDQIQWMEKYLRYEKDVLSLNDFLLSFARYENCKKEIISKNFEVSNVMPDMWVEGHLNVITEEESKMQAIFNKQDKKDELKLNAQENAESKFGTIMKSQLVVNDKLGENRENTIKSKNNLLSLSILKHF
jgi:hypothetical protein